MKIELYTDGSCAGGRGPGGWSAILLAFDKAGQVVREKRLAGSAPDTTNNRMEMIAVIEGLRALTQPASVTVMSDSQYVLNCARGCYRRKKNVDLWEVLDKLAKPHLINWQHIHGHNGNHYNELADKLAVRARHAQAKCIEDILDEQPESQA